MPTTMMATFEPITRTTVSAQIREQLLDRITAGDLVPGSRVPSERELSEQFDVARTSVREAIQGLLSLGVIERRGNRTWVAEQLPEVNVIRGRDTQLFVRQLFETRRALEVPVFALAAARADDADRARVAALMERFRTMPAIDEFRRLDREFHAFIASTCGNQLLIELYGKVLDQLFRSTEFESLLSDTRHADAVAKIINDAIEGHELIADAYATSDATAMEFAVRSHLATIERRLVDDLA